MTRGNQIRIDDGKFTCTPCGDREFSSEEGLLQHCRNAATHRGEWCERCRWLFVSSDARDDHVRASLRHWKCWLCRTDEQSEEDLECHMASEHDHCYECECDFDDYIAHRVESHCRCQDCGEEFENSNNLLMHRQIHLRRNKECYGCYRKFGAVSAILIHLESETCASGVAKEDIDTWAFECYHHRAYTNAWEDDFPYRCPECDTNFVAVSALLQHIESPACDAGYHGAIEELQRYLERSVLNL